MLGAQGNVGPLPWEGKQERGSQLRVREAGTVARGLGVSPALDQEGGRRLQVLLDQDNSGTVEDFFLVGWGGVLGNISVRGPSGWGALVQSLRGCS